MQKKNMTMGLDEAVETPEKENDSKVTTGGSKKEKKALPHLGGFRRRAQDETQHRYDCQTGEQVWNECHESGYDR